MKFEELKVEQLKKELGKLDLPTAGNKAELQKRLLDEFERRSMDIASYEFEDKEEIEVCSRTVASGMDLNTMFAAMMEQMKKMSEENSRKLDDNSRSMVIMIKENSDETSRKMDDNSKSMVQMIKENSNDVLAETSRKMDEASRKMEEKSSTILAEIQENSRITNEKLQEISSEINERVNEMEIEFNKKLTDVKIEVDEKLHNLEAKVNSLQNQEGSVRVIPEVSSRIKAPCFDGSVPLNVFKFQFDTVANRNAWNSEEKAIELILALKGTAAEVLESVPVSSRNNYDEIMVALQRKYGGEHKKEIYKMELRGRVQKANETLQDFALEIERLVQLTYPGENHPFLDHFKTEAFVNGIRDADVKLAVCASQKPTFAETVSFALAQETARIISRPQVGRVRRLDVSANGERDIVQDLKEAVMEALSEKKTKTKVKCYNCGKTGHIQRNCKAPRKRSRSASPPRNNQRACHQSSQEAPLSMEGELPFASEDSIINLVVPKRYKSITTFGYIDGKKRILTIDTGAGFSIIRPDLVTGAVEPLSGVSLRTATGEPATVYGKTRVVLRIANIVNFHEFIVADIIDEVLIGADFMISHNISLNMGRQIMYLFDYEIPLNVGYESEARVGQLLACTRPESSPYRKVAKREKAVAHARQLSRWEARHCTETDRRECISEDRSLQVEPSKDGVTAKRFEPVSAKAIRANSIGGRQNFKGNCPKRVADRSTVNRVCASLPQCNCKALPISEDKQVSSLERGNPYDHRKSVCGHRKLSRYDQVVYSEGSKKGQLILPMNQQPKERLVAKPQLHWKRPHKVIQKLNDVVYRIQKYKSPRAKMKVVHLERLAPYGRGDFEPIRDEQA